MRNAEEFDEFYVSSRRRLLLQTFALTGDRIAARNAVRDAYVAARHHWNKVGRMDEPEDWVRPRAWSVAQRRHNARLWHRERDLEPEQAAVLEALDRLPDVERKTLLLTHLANLPMAEIGREIGETRERAERHLQNATSAMALALDIDSTSIRARLDALEPAVSGIKLPRAPLVRREGRARRRNHAVFGSVLVVVATVLSGAFVVQGASAPRPAAVVPRSMLLGTAQLAGLVPGQAWQHLGTSDNTRGSGLHSSCQERRFADDHGLGTWVRSFRSSGSPRHILTETVDISASPGAARAAFRTTMDWFAGCAVARVQLVDARRIAGVGNQAELVRLRIPGSPGRDYLVAVARTGSLTVSTLVETRNGSSPVMGRLVRTLASGVQRLCRSDAADACVGRVDTTPMLPPSGETPGMLAIGDLPPIGKVNRPWVGTDPAVGSGAATTCDRADFRRGGVARPLTRTFLIPRASLPKRFGITETIGDFGSTAAARKFVEVVKDRMAACPDKSLASTIAVRLLVPKSAGGSQYHLWRLENQVNKRDDKVGYWMGVAQVGRHVAQVNLTPVAGTDLDEQAFRDLVVRARDRLFEVEP